MTTPDPQHPDIRNRHLTESEIAAGVRRDQVFDLIERLSSQPQQSGEQQPAAMSEDYIDIVEAQIKYWTMIRAEPFAQVLAPVYAAARQFAKVAEENAFVPKRLATLVWAYLDKQAEQTQVDEVVRMANMMKAALSASLPEMK